MTNITNGLKKMMGSSYNEDTMETFIKLLELPDDQFNAAYDRFKESYLRVCESVEFQREMKTQMMVMGQVDLEAEKRGIDDFIQLVDDEEELSPKKKDLIKLLFSTTLKVIEQLLASGRETIPVKITKLNPDAFIPQYAHTTDAGADIKAVETVVINAHETKLVKTGLAIAVPAGYEMQIRPRSGLSLKTGLRIANAPATIDSDYRGEIGIIITNISDESYTIEKGNAIAQCLIAPTPMIKWEEVSTVEDLGKTERGEGGFGSTDSTSNKS